MKADEPREPIVKFGMAASEQHKIVERHIAVAYGEKAIEAVRFAYTLAAGPVLRSLRRSAVEPASAPPAIASEPEPEALVDLRRSLGLH